MIEIKIKRWIGVKGLLMELLEELVRNGKLLINLSKTLWSKCFRLEFKEAGQKEIIKYH